MHAYADQEEYEMNLQINSKLGHGHRAIIKCISRRHNLHFYGRELFVLLSIFYNLQSFKRSSETVKGGNNLGKRPREDTLSSFLLIPKSFAVLPAEPGWLGSSSRQEARESWLKHSSGEEALPSKSDLVGAGTESRCSPDRMDEELS